MRDKLATYTMLRIRMAELNPDADIDTFGPVSHTSRLPGDLSPEELKSLKASWKYEYDLISKGKITSLRR